MALPPLNIIYPFDETGTAKSNYIQDELRVVPPVNNRILVPSKGAFYAKSLIVRNNEKTLVAGRDYELCALYQEATEEVGQAVNMMIYFHNPEIEGNVYLTYQVVGGIYTGTWESVQHYVNLLLVDPRKVKWDDVLYKPELYAPMDHFHDVNDVYGLDVIPPELSRIRQVIMRVRTKEMRKVYERILKIKTDTEKLLNLKLKEINTVTNRFISYDERMNQVNTAIAGLQGYINILGNAETLLGKVNTVPTIQTVLDEYQRAIQAHSSSITSLSNKTKTNAADITAKYNELIEKFMHYVELITDNQVNVSTKAGSFIANKLQLNVQEWKAFGITVTQPSSGIVESVANPDGHQQTQTIHLKAPGQHYFRNYNDATSRYITEKIATSFNMTEILAEYMRKLPTSQIKPNSSIMVFDINGNPYKVGLTELRAYILG